MKAISNLDLMDDVLTLVKQKQDFISALVATYSLPDKPIIKRILGANPFEASLLSEAMQLCKNYDYAIRLYKSFKLYNLLGSNRYGYEYTPDYVNRDVLQFLRDMLRVYGESGIVHMMENAKEINLKDCIRLYQQLKDENQRAIKTEKVRIRDLHDWMSYRHKLQNHENLKFNVPNHIIRRLSMQNEKLKFFLPKESMELLKAGVELHNCVASYSRAMQDNSKWVVLVANDKGKLVACLEVQGRRLIQAKIDKNKPVSSDNKLNAEVISWAKEANLEIKTNDLKVQTESATSVAV
ncbi:PcfJ domain-containing protein [Desulforamulus reducens]|nr:PcfJ domain-containing protein [Desulforamulus reducens]